MQTFIMSGNEWNVNLFVLKWNGILHTAVFLNLTNLETDEFDTMYEFKTDYHIDILCILSQTNVVKVA